MCAAKETLIRKRVCFHYDVRGLRQFCSSSRIDRVAFKQRRLVSGSFGHWEI